MQYVLFRNQTKHHQLKGHSGPFALRSQDNLLTENQDCQTPRSQAPDSLES